MTILEELLAQLERLPIWRRLNRLPQEIGDLNQRVLALESRLNGGLPQDICRYCGEPAARLVRKLAPDDGGRLPELWGCSDCGLEELRRIEPGNPAGN